MSLVRIDGDYIFIDGNELREQFCKFASCGKQPLDDFNDIIDISDLLELIPYAVCFPTKKRKIWSKMLLDVIKTQSHMNPNVPIKCNFTSAIVIYYSEKTKQAIVTCIKHGPLTLIRYQVP